MNDFSTSVMVALLPTTSDWCQIELPHLTLVYAGTIEELRSMDRNVLAKTAVSLAMTSKPITLFVKRLEVFGEEDPVDVLTLVPTPELIAMRMILDSWNRSEYKDYKPHVTIGPAGSFDGDIPDTITFDRISVCWGSEHLTYSLTATD